MLMLGQQIGLIGGRWFHVRCIVEPVLAGFGYLRGGDGA